MLHNWAKADVDGREAQAPTDRNRRTGLRVGRRLRDELSFDTPCRLVNATIQDGVLVAFFETPNEPSGAECREFWRLTMQALPVFRRPCAFRCVMTYPVGTTDLAYIG